MKVLLLDIETAPNIVYAWGLYNQNISLAQIKSSGYVLCWSAKWLGAPTIYSGSLQSSSPRRMLAPIHNMMSEADVLMHYNGKKFDIPTLNREFLLHGMSPPSPSKQIDLYHTCRRAFRFTSNKLDYVSSMLGIGGKKKHKGHDMWTGCMNGDAASWKSMIAYNKQDVSLLEKLYTKLRPWISNHPSHHPLIGVPCCPKCGSEDFRRDGIYTTQIYKYERFNCRSCGGWFRGTKTITKASIRTANIPE